MKRIPSTDKNTNGTAMRHIPNILTAFRVVLVGIFIWLFIEAQEAAAGCNTEFILPAVVYITAFFTDLLDGYLARRNNWVSNFGKLFDPFADKLMLITVLVCFYVRNYIKLYVLILVAVKELIMVVGGGILLLRKVVVYADWTGKIATGAFMAAVMLTFINIIWGVPGFYHYVYIAAVVLSFASMIHYGTKNVICRKHKGSPD